VKIQIQETPFGRMQNSVMCGDCQGSGKVISKACNSCHGSGVNTKEVEYEFDIPRGIMDGEMLKVGGMGKIMDGEMLKVGGMGNAVKNGIDGDLIINIVEIPHDKFRRVGNDIHQTLNLTYKDLVLGNDDVHVDTMEGKIKFKIKEGTKIGSMY
jgi:molecular chaperone DnaJ